MHLKQRPAKLIQTHSYSPVINSQEEGIGRMTALGALLAINNLGRNIEISAIIEDRLELIGLFADSICPNDDLRSQFDLDMHAFLMLPDEHAFLAINHDGLARVISLEYLPSITKRSPTIKSGKPLRNELLVEKRIFRWAPDVMQFCWSRNHLLSTSGYGYKVSSPAESGILVSDRPWDINCKLTYHQELTDWGFTTAITSGIDADSALLASAKRIGFIGWRSDRTTDQFFETQWETSVDFSCSWLHVDATKKILIAGGPCENKAPDLDDPAEWTNLQGGGFALIDIETGSLIAQSDFGVDLAWGNGGVPLSWVESLDSIAGVDRTGGLFVWNRQGTRTQLSAQLTQEPMGIAHLCNYQNALYCGFNRGGYSIYRYEIQV